MKKTIKTLAAVLCCALAFTACTKDEPGNPTPETDLTPVAALMDYTLTMGEDMLNMCDITIEYYDTDGKVKNEALTKGSWEKRVLAPLPASLGVRVKAKLKSGANPSSQESFTAAYGYDYMGYAVNSTGGVVSDVVGRGSSTSMSMKGDKVEEWLTRHADGLFSFLYSFDAKGKPTRETWE